MILISYFLGVILIIIFSVIKMIEGYNLGYILILIGATLMLLLGLALIIKSKKIKIQADRYLVNFFIFFFALILLYITFTYIKAGHIIGGLLALFFAIIIFGILRNRIAFYRVKEGITSNVAKLLSKDYEFTMQLPPGWQTHPHLESEFFEWKNKEDNWGRVESFPLELKDEAFSKFVDREVRSYLDEVYGSRAKKNGYSQIISKEVKQISGKETVQVAIDMEESVEFYTYIRNNSECICVLYKLPKNQFSQKEFLIRNSIASIRINQKLI